MGARPRIRQPVPQVLQDIRALVLYPDVAGNKVTARGRAGRWPRSIAVALGTFAFGLLLLGATRRASRSGYATPAIEVRGVTKTFQLPHQRRTTFKEHFLHPSTAPVRASGRARDVTFAVEQGEFFGIVGANGSGKSTLLKIIAGIYRQDEGDVVVRGQLSPFIELGVGFNSELNARDNVRINGTLLGSRSGARGAIRRDHRVRRARALRRPEAQELLLGMQVRLAFSIAIQVPFDVLLLDEVLAVGTPRSRRSASTSSTTSRPPARRSSSSATISHP